MRFPALVAALSLVVAGCSQSRQEAPRTVGANALEVVRGHALWAKVGTLTEVRVERDALVHAAASRRVDGAIPRRSLAPIVISSRERAALRLEVVALDLRETEGSVEGSSVVFAGAKQGTDVVLALTPGGLEELRVVRESSGPIVARYSIHASPAVAQVRVREGRIEALDAEGVVRLDTEPMFALDAKHVRRALLLTSERSGDDTVVTATLDTKDLALPIVIDPIWGPGGSMAVKRERHTATLLASGQVLAVGGVIDSSGATTTVTELYTPSTNTWSTVAALATGRIYHGAVRLPSGDVLVISGAIVSGGTPTCEIYSVAGKTWKTVAPIGTTPRFRGTAQVMASGKVLFVGGTVDGFTPVATAQVYDPTLDTWTTITPYPVAVVDVKSALLPSGKVLVAGGTGASSSPKTTYTFDGSSWASAGSLARGRSGHTLTRLASGKVVAIGGFGDVINVDKTSEIYDPATDAWTGGPTLALNRASHVAALLLGEKILVTSFNSAEIYDSAGTSTVTVPPSIIGHSYGAAVTLASGKVLAVGGDDGSGNPVGSELFTGQDIGFSCASDAECIGGHCADGVCCDSACTKQCQACDIAGKVGTCSTVASGPVHGGRPTCSPYQCSAGDCATTCAVSTDCATGNYCDGAKHCVALKANGATCAGGGECSSGSCTDGVCCNSACGGQCEACNVAGAIGACSPVSGAPHGARSACTSGGATCNALRCDGSDRSACHNPPTSTTCSANACSGGIETHASTCDGAGACTDVAKSCGSYVCGATACKTTCTSKADCIGGYSCVGGACTPSVDLGKPCSGPSACGDLFCVDSVCCGVAACAADESCAIKAGTCTKKNGSACTLDPQCGSGHCADGVCCDTACGGQCEACDVAGSVGLCFPVSGDPHGSRDKCAAGAGLCEAARCDGTKNRSKCAGFVHGSETACGASSCAIDQFTSSTTCDGAGACQTAGRTSCVPYRCNDAGCLVSCTSDDQCSPTFVCKGSKCVSAEGATCTDDKSASIAKDGTKSDCSPYRCQSDGTCAKACATTDDCASGFLCQVGFCIAAPIDAGDSGGCAASGVRSPRGALFAWLSTALLLGLARRRQAAGGRDRRRR